jgi:rhodanese-related sulfurtransferase
MKALHFTPGRMAALLLLSLGITGLFAGDPYHRSTARVNTRELAAIVEGEVDHVPAQELADWIIQGQTDFRLIDLRTEQEYASYFIPYAERVPIASLMDYELARPEKIVLYSEGGIHSFGGAPRPGAEETTLSAPMPAPPPPQLSAQAGVQLKKRKEGC